MSVFLLVRMWLVGTQLLVVGDRLYLGSDSSFSLSDLGSGCLDGWDYFISLICFTEKSGPHWLS